MLTRDPSAPIAGPPAIWPIELTWLLMDKTVARTLESTFWLIQAW
jgi:hypothetical protein